MWRERFHLLCKISKYQASKRYTGIDFQLVKFLICINYFFFTAPKRTLNIIKYLIEFFDWADVRVGEIQSKKLDLNQRKNELAKLMRDKEDWKEKLNSITKSIATIQDDKQKVQFWFCKKDQEGWKDSGTLYLYLMFKINLAFLRRQSHDLLSAYKQVIRGQGEGEGRLASAKLFCHSHLPEHAIRPLSFGLNILL